MGQRIGIVGENFANSDGTSRQAEIERCSVGEKVKLRHDPNNKHDPNYVQVISARGIQIGNLSKEHAAMFAPHLRAGHDVDAEIAKINGGTRSRPVRGVVIEAHVDEEDFEKTRRYVRRHDLAGRRFHVGRSAPADDADQPVKLVVAGALVAGLLIWLLFN